MLCLTLLGSGGDGQAGSPDTGSGSPDGGTDCLNKSEKDCQPPCKWGKWYITA